MSVVSIDTLSRDTIPLSSVALHKVLLQSEKALSLSHVPMTRSI
jgi:hypothetical protein